VVNIPKPRKPRRKSHQANVVQPENPNPELPSGPGGIFFPEWMKTQLWAAAHPLDDVGNGCRLVDWFGQELRHCDKMDKWFIWDGRRGYWRDDEDQEIVRQAKAVARLIRDEAKHCDDSHHDGDVGDRRQEPRSAALRKWAKVTESQPRIKAMIQMASSERSIAIRVDQLNTNPWLLNCRNGTLNLETRGFRAHDRSDLLTKALDVEYHREAQCPHWMKFLETVQPDEAMRDFLQEAIGYCLTGVTSERVMFILHGDGANGKTTFLETIHMLLGGISPGGYSKRTPAQTMLVKWGSSIPNDLAALVGARFVYASELEEGQRLAESLIKDLTGGDTISARLLHKEWFQFKPEFKLWLATNHKPEVRGSDKAIWDRIRVIPFDTTIEPRRPQHEVMSEFQSELEGILAWAVAGCIRWKERGNLLIPDKMLGATTAYRSEMQDNDPIHDFILQKCEKDQDAEVNATELFNSYCEWCETTRQQPMTITAFGRWLTLRGYAVRETAKGRQRTGLRLKPPTKPSIMILKPILAESWKLDNSDLPLDASDLPEEWK